MCVDFSAREAAEIFSWKELGYYRPLANGYIYGNRKDDAYHGEGMEPRDAMDTWCKYGIPPADVYNVTGTYDQCKAYYDAHKGEADAAAKPQRLLKHAVCFTPAEVKGALYHLQSPVMITVIVTGLFETALFMRRDGQIPVEPSRNYEEGAMTFKGYHEMVIKAYKPIDGVLYYGCQGRRSRRRECSSARSAAVRKWRETACAAGSARC
jgi:hypothetical protein